MQWKLRAIATALVALFAIGSGMGQLGSAQAACGPGDVIDNTTVADTRKKIEEAGYQEPTDLRKGCDNFWHATAEKDGSPVRLLVTPTGEVLQEGD